MTTAPLCLLLLALATQDPNTSGDPLVPEEAAYDVLHYELVLEVFPERKTIEGSLTMRARAVVPTERIALDLDSRLAVEAVRSGDETLETERAGNRLFVELGHPVAAGDELELTVAYGGAPRVAPRPPWDGGFTWTKTRDGRPWIATSCQGEGADLWWPCKDQPSDKPDSMDLSITVPAGLVCASNGVLEEQRELPDGRTVFDWHVASPIANYAVALNIAPYEVIESSFHSVGGETVPVYFYVLPEDLEKGRQALPEFLHHMAFFEDLLGPYPFRAEKYGIAETPHLGMEHQTIIAYGAKFRPDRTFHYDWLHHHELSHEWWANLVTARDWKDMWLHEGFGTYMQSLYIEREQGPEAYRKIMATQRRHLSNRRPIAPRRTRNTKQIYFADDGGYDNDIYDKGSWVLHTLRWTIGDEAFFTALRRMAYPDPALEKVTDGSQCRFVDTEDFVAIAEAAAGEELDWFFEVYVRQPKLPRLETERLGDELVLKWKSPLEQPFPMPVPVRIGERIVRVEMPGGEARVHVGTADVEVDPENRLLRE